FSPVEVSAVSKEFPSTGARHSPPIKCPNRPCRPASHASDSFGSSGAGPYSIDLNFSATLICLFSFNSHPEISTVFRRNRTISTGASVQLHRAQLGPSSHRVPVIRRIASRHMEFQLPLDICQHSTRAKPKQVR